MARSHTQKVENASAQAGRNSGYTEQAAEVAKEYAAEAVDRAAAIANEAYQDPQRFIHETQEDLARRTRENPLQTLAWAAGIGFVIGALWKK